MTPSPTHLLMTQALVAGWQRPLSQPVSLTLCAGEITGVVGPNGVGKSTLLAALCGHAPIFAGHVERTPGTRLAWQTQEIPALGGLPLSGRDLLVLSGASGDGLPPWLADRLDERLDQLSGGQRHYLALWAVLQSPADLLLLDEPTNNLDPAGVDHLISALRARAAAGLGILIVSHDKEFVAAVCQQVLTLEAASA